ncbi:MAG: TIR domain-containing protein [Candidatus Gastranaerophilales bacterium]
MSWNRKIFISHCWSYDDAYETIKGWLETAQYYSFADYSISMDQKLVGLTESQLKLAIAERIRQCSIFIVPTGMYCNGRDWIEYEIKTAKNMGKPILAVRPRGQEKNSRLVIDNADKIVGWNQKSVIEGVKVLTANHYINNRF